MTHLIALTGELILSGSIGRSAEVLHMTCHPSALLKGYVLTSAETMKFCSGTEQYVDRHWHEAGDTLWMSSASLYALSLMSYSMLLS